MTRIYKLLDQADWTAALAAGRYEGSSVDRADGFIHFSTEEQLAETARRHFAGRSDLVCLAVETSDLGGLRWEPSRGGALFPHLYGPLEVTQVVAVSPAPLDVEGVPHVQLEGA